MYVTKTERQNGKICKTVKLNVSAIGDSGGRACDVTGVVNNNRYEAGHATVNVDAEWAGVVT